MIEIDNSPLFNDSRCNNCHEEKDGTVAINITNRIIRLCKDCRKKLIEVVKSVD